MVLARSLDLFTQLRSFGFRCLGIQLGLAYHRVVDLLAVNGDVGWRLHTDADLVPPNVDDGDDDVVADLNRLVAMASKNQHESPTGELGRQGMTPSNEF